MKTNQQHFLYTEGGGYNAIRVKNPDAIEFLIIDLFCGAGGTSTGFHRAFIGGDQVALVMACINHDPIAIKSHWRNYPDVVHFEEDIRTVELHPIVELIAKYRMLYPNAKIILWASLECTNFSKAKGGQARDADSRTLAEHLDRYVEALDPDYIQIENVVEFMSWGPLDQNGKPVSRKAGSDWLKWCKHIDSFGYRNEWKQLNSADFGAYTSRNRLFGCFAKAGLPIVWPATTHAKKPGVTGMFGAQQKWKAVKEVLDFEDEGISIFNRKKPLVDASLERIEAGLIKFVAGGKDAFILKYNSMAKNGNRKQSVMSVDVPAPVIPCQNRTGLCFIAKYYSGKPAGMVTSVESPAGTIKCKDGQSLIQCEYFLSKAYSGKPEGKVIPVTGPAGTLPTVCNHSLIKAVPFIAQRNGGDPLSRVHSVDNPARTLTSTGGNQEVVTVKPFILNTNFKNVGSSIEEPSKTLLASRHHPYILNPVFLAKYYGTGDNVSSVEDPAGTLVTKDRYSKVHPIFLDKTFSGRANISSIENPAGTLMPCDKHRLINCQPFILNPSHGGHCSGTDVPCVVIIARQDKSPLYLIQFNLDPYVSVPIYEGDSPVMIRIKEFMALYGLADIKMRMLKVPELILIQGFPKDYVLEGNQTDQKKFIGNSVVPHVVTSWCLEMAQQNRKLRVAA
jgi:DNA (cytosine-5)-methyltransferase 1